MELSILAVILGFILDLIVGDPHWLYHPIRLVGHLISGLEKILRKVFPKIKTWRTDSRSIPVDPHSRNHIGSSLDPSVRSWLYSSVCEICVVRAHVLSAPGDQIFEDGDHEGL